jgi:hypothetical protein
MSSLKTTARVTGALYLALAVTGVVGFMLIRSALFVTESPTATAANLVAQEGLARLGLAMELGIVLTQALVAIAFAQLFRSVHAVAAGAIAAFGLMNSAAILVSFVALGGALAVALDPALAPSADPAPVAQLMYLLSSSAWTGGSLFFGLWLIPMGWCVILSGWMPRLLGQVLIVGGLGYVLSGFVAVLLPAAPDWAEIVLTVPATIGEFWIMGYLLIFGVRPPAAQ